MNRVKILQLNDTTVYHNYSNVNKVQRIQKLLTICHNHSNVNDNILLSNMYGKISRVVKARITRVPQARVQYGALTTSGILPYAFDNVFIICLCVKRNADSAVRCSSKSLGQGRIEQCTRRESYCRRLTVVLPSQAPLVTPLIPQLIQKPSWSFL